MGLNERVPFTRVMLTETDSSGQRSSMPAMLIEEIDLLPDILKELATSDSPVAVQAGQELQADLAQQEEQIEQIYNSRFAFRYLQETNVFIHWEHES